jgi:hypothetical protein
MAPTLHYGVICRALITNCLQASSRGIMLSQAVGNVSA